MVASDDAGVTGVEAEAFEHILASRLVNVRVQRAIESAETAANDALSGNLAELATAIGTPGSDAERLRALVTVANAIANLSASREVAILSEFEATSVLHHIVQYCDEDHSRVAVLGTGLSVLGNVAFLGALELVVSAQAPALYVRLLCSDSPAEVIGYTAAALGNLCADAYGAATIEAADRARVLEVLDAIIESGSYPLPVQAHALVATKNIRAIQSKLSEHKLAKMGSELEKKAKRQREAILRGKLTMSGATANRLVPRSKSGASNASKRKAALGSDAQQKLKDELLRDDPLVKRNAARTMQREWRSYRERTLPAELQARRVKAAVTISRYVRGWQTRSLLILWLQQHKEATRNVHRRRNGLRAALTVQRIARGYLGRVRKASKARVLMAESQASSLESKAQAMEEELKQQLDAHEQLLAQERALFASRGALTSVLSGMQSSGPKLGGKGGRKGALSKEISQISQIQPLGINIVAGTDLEAGSKVRESAAARQHALAQRQRPAETSVAPAQKPRPVPSQNTLRSLDKDGILGGSPGVQKQSNHPTSGLGSADEQALRRQVAEAQRQTTDAQDALRKESEESHRLRIQITELRQALSAESAQRQTDQRAATEAAERWAAEDARKEMERRAEMGIAELQAEAAREREKEERTLKQAAEQRAAEMEFRGAVLEQQVRPRSDRDCHFSRSLVRSSSCLLSAVSFLTCPPCFQQPFQALAPPSACAVHVGSSFLRCRTSS